MAIVDKKTPRLGLLLPNADNFLQDDVERLIQSFDLLDVLVVMRDQTTGKIADDQLSEVIARLDAQGKIATSALPSSVVQKGADGKIDSSVLPSIAIIDSFPVPNEASMLGLQCERGDIAIRTDLGRSFILTDLPPSKLSNWRELTSTNVTSVNGQVGAITGLAKAGVNDDITQLTALSGPLRLGGEAAGDYDAVTLKQLRAASGGAGGASMNGVMNNFIGAVEWFSGSRAKLPAGYIAADGQLVSRTDPATADLWAAVNAGIYASTATDAAWINSGIANALWNNRGMYSPGDGSTTFRVPDLNSQFNAPDQNLTPQGLFLRSQGRLTGNGVGNIIENAAPNITGQIRTVTANSLFESEQGAIGGQTGVFVGIEPQPYAMLSTQPGATSTYPRTIKFDASRGIDGTGNGGNAAYGRFDSSEIRPNAVLGIWIIRASGTFTAQNSNFNVITGDTTAPANNTLVAGGKIISAYQIAGKDVYRTRLYSQGNYGVSHAAIMAVENIQSDGTPIGMYYRFDSRGVIDAGRNGGLDLSTSSPAIVAGNSLFTFGENGVLTTQGKIKPKLVVDSWSTNSAMIEGSVSTSNYDTYSPFAMGITSTPNWTLFNSVGFYLGAGGNPNTAGIALVSRDNGSYSARWVLRNSGVIGGPAGDISIGNSDRNLKHEITDATDGAPGRIMKLRPRDFIWNSDGREDRGFIAQEVIDVDDRYVYKPDGSEYYMLSDRAIMADMVTTIQQLEKRVNDLEAKN